MDGGIAGIVLCGTDKKNPEVLRQEIERLKHSYGETFLIGEHKSKLYFRGKLLSQIVVDALNGSKGIGRVYAVGPAELLDNHLTGCEIVDSDGSFGENITRGISRAGSERVIIAACDMPLINPDSIDRFIGACEESQANVCYPIVLAEAFEPYHGFKDRPVFKLRSGGRLRDYRLGNLVYLEPEKCRKLFNFYDAIREGRKTMDMFSYLKMLKVSVNLLGAGTPLHILRYYAKRLSVDGFGKIASKAFEARCSLIETNDPAIGIDIDSWQDIKHSEFLPEL